MGVHQMNEEEVFKELLLQQPQRKVKHILSVSLSHNEMIVESFLSYPCHAMPGRASVMLPDDDDDD